MKYSGLNGGNGNGSSRWRFKSTTVKAFVICLFAFSTVFITYQLIYYMNLTEYQSQETQSRQQGLFHENQNNHAVIEVVGVPPPSPKDDSLVVIGGAVVDGSQQPPRPHGSVLERKKGKPVLSLGNRLIGVKPTDIHLYQDQQLNDRNYFKCFNTHKKITWEKVNDDFCDCPFDGSDEPSTSACDNGKFYCLRRDGIKGYIPSSRVNDGVCDCLDATDEHGGIGGTVKCKKVALHK